jgi:PHD/YefM family antitoxin component YafN of YafNO toxin-antitoxin module
MQTTTIPKTITKGKELVILPREEYQALVQKAKFYQELDAELDESLAQVERGETTGPFDTAEKLIQSLKS